MENPWTDCEDAFAPMFSDTVTVVSGGVKRPVRSCVFPMEDVEPMTDLAVESSVKRFQVLVRKQDWTSTRRMAVGDSVEYRTVKTRIETVDDEQSWYKLVIRSV